MRVEMAKFGKVLVSRPLGREAASILRGLVPEGTEEPIELDFHGVFAVGPSFLDEVLAALEEYGDRVVVLDAGNPSVTASLRTIREAE